MLGGRREMRKTLYLTRHGQTILNAQNRTQGAFDSPLTQQGIEQARCARSYFQKNGITFDAVYSSTQERACDTCEIMQDGAYTRLKGLKEWHFGVFEGYPDNMKNGTFQTNAQSFEDGLVAFGGESRQQVGQRMVNTLIEVLEKNDTEQTVLAVSHGGAMWAFALTANLDQLPQPPYSNCCIIKYEYENGQFYFIEKIDPLLFS